MIRLTVALALLALAAAAQAPVLIVADEFPAMEIVAGKLQHEEGIASAVVPHTAMPAELSAHRAVIVYIHRDIAEETERRLIEYASRGGRLVLLHHSISSGKRKNKDWLPFLGVELPAKPFPEGGYRWIDPVAMDIVNLTPSEFITTNKVEYESRISFRAGSGDMTERPGFTLEHTEVYLNHVLSGERKILLGLKYTDPAAGTVYMQGSAGWCRRAGSGWVLYFMPGHSVKEFEHPAFSRIVLNAVIARLE